MEAFAQSVLRDYLREKGYSDTLATLTEEARRNGTQPPSIESWYEVSSRLDLPDLIRQNNGPDGRKHLTLLEVLLERLLETTRREQLAYRVPTVTSTIRQPARSGGGGGKGRRRQTPEERAEAHATALAASMSAASMKSAPVSSQPPSQQLTQHRARRGRQAQAGVGAANNTHTGGGTGNAGERETRLTKPRGKPAQKLQSRAVVVTALTSGASGGSGSGKGGGGLFGDEEDLGPSKEAWMPMEVRMRMLRDELATGRARAEVQQREERRLAKKSGGPTQLELEKTKEKYLCMREQKCGLCGLTFLRVNLPMTVSHKAVVDLRSSWAAARKAIGGDPTLDAVGGEAALALDTFSRPPLCYDGVPICVFCAQFFDGPSAQQAYRPVEDEDGMGLLAGHQQATGLFDPVLDIDKSRS